MDRAHSTPQLATVAMGGLAILLGLNLNGVFAMGCGAERAGSSLILGRAVLVLVLCRGRALASPLFVLAGGLLVGYLLFGALAVAFTSDPFQAEYVVRYLGVLLIVGGTASYFVGLRDDEVRSACIFLKCVLLAACLATLFSQQLYTLSSNPL